MENTKKAIDYVTRNSKPMVLKAMASVTSSKIEESDNKKEMTVEPSYHFDGSVLKVKVDLKGGISNVHSNNFSNVNNSDVFTSRIHVDAPIHEDRDSFDVLDMGNQEDSDSGSKRRNEEKREIKYNRLFKTLSIFSNKISDYLKNIIFEDSVKEFEMQKTESFYSIIQNAVFRSFMKYFDFQESLTTNKDGNEVKRFDFNPEVEEDDAYIPMLLIFDRLMDDFDLSETLDINETMKEYYDRYQDDQIDEFYYKLLTDRLHEKLPYTFDGIEAVVTKLNSIIDNPRMFEEDEVVDLLTEDEVKEYHSHNHHDYLCGHHECNCSHHDFEGDEEESNFIINVIRNIEFADKLSKDMIRISTADEFGEVNIPIYTSLDEKINPVDSGANGIWNFLTMFTPDMIFKTKNPGSYIYLLNDREDIDENQAHVVILGEDGEESIMGLYSIDGIYDQENNLIDDKNYIKMISDAIVNELSHTKICALDFVLNNSDIDYINEDDIKKILNDDYKIDPKFWALEIESGRVVEKGVEITPAIKQDDVPVKEITEEDLEETKEGDTEMLNKDLSLTEDDMDEIEKMIQVEPIEEEKDKYEEMLENDPKYSQYLEEDQTSFKPIKRKKNKEQ